MQGSMTEETPCRLLDWNQEDESTFAPEFGSEMFWLWTQADKEKFPSCPIKGNIRLVLLTWNDKCDEEEYVITFRCGMTRVVVQEILQTATAKRNDFLKAKSKPMKAHRLEALAEKTTPAYSVTHGFRVITASIGTKGVMTSTPEATPSTVPHTTVTQDKEIDGEGGTSTGENAIGAGTVIDSGQSTTSDSTTLAGDKDIGGERTRVAIDTEGTTSTGENAIGAGTVVDSGQSRTSDSTTLASVFVMVASGTV
jgi:hypothetical protein